MLFRFLANCFLLFCSSFVVLKFPSLLANIQRPNWRLAKGPHPVSTQLFDPCPLYSFTQMHAQGFAVIVNFMMMWNFNFKGMLTPYTPLRHAYSGLFCIFNIFNKIVHGWHVGVLIEIQGNCKFSKNNFMFHLFLLCNYNYSK